MASVHCLRSSSTSTTVLAATGVRSQTTAMTSHSASVMRIVFFINVTSVTSTICYAVTRGKNFFAFFPLAELNAGRSRTDRNLIKWLESL